MRPVIFLPILGLFASITRAGGSDVFTRVEQIRALTPEQARRHHPVKLQGIITYFDTESGHGFLHDETGSIFFRPGHRDTSGAVSARSGDEVEISGITWAGSFSPSVAGSPGPGPVRLRKLGEGELPEPRSVPFDQLKTGRWHDQFVSVRATVRDFSAADGGGERPLTLVLSGPGGKQIKAWGKRLDLGDSAAWLDQEVTVTAVVAGGGNASGQLHGAHLLIGESSWIMREDEAMRHMFDQPPLEMGQVGRYHPPQMHSQRTRIDGTISLVRPGEGFFLTNGTRGIEVETTQRTEFLVGDLVSVAGYLNGRSLSDGIVRVKARGSSPAARLVHGEEIAGAKNENALVSLEGWLREVGGSIDSPLLKIETQDGRVVHAKGGRFDEALDPGSRLIVTGVVTDGILNLRDAADIVILQHPAWLTRGRRNALVVGGLIAIVAVTLWLSLLKSQVARQTRLIESQLVQSTLDGERQRMARDLHDSLEQNLIGLHIQLGTLQEKVADAPDSVRKLASGASRMLDHCRDEARRTVYELRTQILQTGGLAAALNQLAGEVSDGRCPQIKTEISGESTRLDPRVEFHLLRCAQEGLANALKHADARKVAIRLEYRGDEIRLIVADDGNGFDLEQNPPSENPGFGLLHLKERAARINADFFLESTPGSGTTITITVPTA